MSVLKGDGLFLRPIVRSDLEYLNNWKNTEDVYKYLGGVSPCIDRYPGAVAWIIDGHDRKL